MPAANESSRRHPPHAGLARGFRPFFALAGLHAALFPPLWAAIASGWLAAPPWLGPGLWHAHEMLYGFAAAAAAGFLLTAVPVWTGARALQGAPLGALAALWVAGRIAMLAAAQLPGPLVALVDLAFPAALLTLLLRPLARPGQLRNRGFPVLLALFFAANAAMHLDALGLAPGAGPRAARVALDAVLLLVVVIGGRIVPAFTQNALRRAGNEHPVRVHRGLAAASIAAAAAVLLSDALVPGSALAGAAKGLAAAALTLRMAGWQALATRSDPLLWSLHAGYACAPLGLALLCAAELGAPLAPAAGLHALGIGCFGTLILAVMSRVALGHTGRPLRAPPPLPFAYAAVLAAAALRVTAALQPALAQPATWAAALLFAAAFSSFLAVYLPILATPRRDGLEG